MAPEAIRVGYTSTTCWPSSPDILGARMRAHGICPSWHYHPEDIPTLAHGWLLGAGKPVPERLKSDDISRACGVDPDQFGRHTALGDCRWMRALYDVVTGREVTAMNDK